MITSPKYPGQKVLPGKSGVLTWEFEIQNTETSCQLAAVAKDGKMLGGSSRTLASRITDKSLRLEGSKTVSGGGGQLTEMEKEEGTWRVTTL